MAGTRWDQILNTPNPCYIGVLLLLIQKPLVFLQGGRGDIICWCSVFLQNSGKECTLACGLPYLQDLHSCLSRAISVGMVTNAIQKNAHATVKQQGNQWPWSGKTLVTLHLAVKIVHRKSATVLLMAILIIHEPSVDKFGAKCGQSGLLKVILTIHT